MFVFCSKVAVLPSGYILIGDRIIKYNYENNNIYVGDAFYVSEGKIIEINKSSEILMDTILFDFKTKTFRDVTQPYYENTYLVNLFTDITKNKNAGIKKNKDKTSSFVVNDPQIATLSGSKIISLILPGIQEIRGLPRHFGKFVCHLSIPDKFFEDNLVLCELNAPRLKRMRSGCFKIGKLKDLNLPELEIMGDQCFLASSTLENLNAPKLRIMGESCFKGVTSLKTLDLPKLEQMHSNCFKNNVALSEQLEKICGNDNPVPSGGIVINLLGAQLELLQKMKSSKIQKIK